MAHKAEGTMSITFEEPAALTVELVHWMGDRPLPYRLRDAP
jgi:hypothetical protein